MELRREKELGQELYRRQERVDGKQEKYKYGQHQQQRYSDYAEGSRSRQRKLGMYVRKPRSERDDNQRRNLSYQPRLMEKKRRSK